VAFREHLFKAHAPGQTSDVATRSTGVSFPRPR